MSPKESKPKSQPVATEGSAAQCATPIEISPELLNALQVRFKLTESQSRAYTTLLIMGQLTADEISNYSGIPMVKIRSTIETLENKQLTKPLPGVVTRYRAFAPYQELSKEVQTFSKDTQKSWKELQELQTKTLSEIHEELQLMTRQVRSALENLNERQGIALNEAAMATNIVLNNVAETLKKSLNNLSTLSVDEISELATSTQHALINLIDEGSTNLDETQKLALEDASKAINAHQEDSKQWVSSIADQLLGRVTASNQRISTHLEEAIGEDLLDMLGLYWTAASATTLDRVGHLVGISAEDALRHPAFPVEARVPSSRFDRETHVAHGQVVLQSKPVGLRSPTNAGAP